MFALPPISPMGGFARSLFGPALSLTAIWSMLSAPGWIVDAQRFYASALEPRMEFSCAVEGSHDMTSCAYDGQLLEANNKLGVANDPIVTYFNRTNTGQLVGWYMVKQDGKTYMGTLSQGEEEVSTSSNSHLYHFKWRDQYGTGGADFVFSQDHSRFSGSWESDTNREWCSMWSGLRR